MFYVNVLPVHRPLTLDAGIVLLSIFNGERYAGFVCCSRTDRWSEVCKTCGSKEQWFLLRAYVQVLISLDLTEKHAMFVCVHEEISAYNQVLYHSMETDGNSIPSIMVKQKVVVVLTDLLLNLASFFSYLLFVQTQVVLRLFTVKMVCV